MVVKSEKIDKDCIYIVISRTPTGFGRLVRRALGSELNHVSLSLDQDLKKMYSFGRLMLKNPFVAGIINESREALSLHTNNGVYVKIFRLNISREQYERLEEKIHTMFNDAEGYFYNYLGIIGIYLHVRISLYKTYICSEFTLEMLKYIGIRITEKDTSLVTPDEVANLLAANLVYEGQLREYNRDFSQNPGIKTKKKKVYKRTEASHRFFKKESRGIVTDLPYMLRFYGSLIRRDIRKRISA